MTNIENILNPEISFLDYKNNLIEKYIEDYGEEYKDTIIDRMNKTLYLFDSNPKDKLLFILNNEKSIDDKYLVEVEKEYNNYQRIKRKIHNSMIKKYYNYLSVFFNVSNSYINEDILNLDIDSFSLENQAKLSNSEINEKIKDKIIKRQIRYLAACKENNVEPLTDGIKIHLIERERDRLKRNEIKHILLKTSWGKKILKKFRDYNPKIELSDIVKIMRQEEVGAADFLLDESYEETSRILYYPIMRNIKYKSLDRMFFHENRHIIEAGKDHVGINTHLGNKYQMLNEIRTEKHAIEDSKHFINNVLWSNEEMPEHSYNGYEELFPYTYNFYDDNKDLLDELSFSGKIEELENIYGEDNLIRYDYFLKDLSDLLSKNHYKYKSIEKEEEAKKLVYNLNRQNNK